MGKLGKNVFSKQNNIFAHFIKGAKEWHNFSNYIVGVPDDGIPGNTDHRGWGLAACAELPLSVTYACAVIILRGP